MDFASNLHFEKDDQVIGVLYLALLKQALESDGLSLKLRTLTANDLTNPKLRVSLRTFIEILSDSLQNAPAGIGLRYGQHLNLVAADSLGQLIMSCDSLYEALNQIQRYRLLLTLPFSFEHHTGSNSDHRAETACVTFRGLYSATLPKEVNWFISEVLFLCIQNQARWLSGHADLHFQALHFPYPKPPHAAQYESTLDCPCIFGDSRHAMFFDESYLKLPVVTRNPELKKHKQITCDDALTRWTRNFSTSQRLQALFKHRFPDLPCVEQAAEQLNLSKSCLHRRLQEEGLSYQTLLNSFKKQRSEYLLKHTNYTMNEIAEQLGFCDGSTFRRAFKSWTGLQPSMVREAT